MVSRYGREIARHVGVEQRGACPHIGRDALLVSDEVAGIFLTVIELFVKPG
jgi:hypothetical protein